MTPPFEYELIELNCLIQNISRYAGTGCLVCRQDNKDVLLYFRLGQLIHACYGNTVGPLALFWLLHWSTARLNFEPAVVSPEESLTVNQVTIFMRALRLFQKQPHEISPIDVTPLTIATPVEEDNPRAAELRPEPMSADAVATGPVEKELANLPETVEKITSSFQFSPVSSDEPKGVFEADDLDRLEYLNEQPTFYQSSSVAEPDQALGLSEATQSLGEPSLDLNKLKVKSPFLPHDQESSEPNMLGPVVWQVKLKPEEA